MRLTIFMLLFFLGLYDRYDIAKYTQVKYNKGYAVNFTNGKKLTALHLIENNDIIIYSNKDKDIAIIQQFENNTRNKNVNKINFIINDEKPIILIDKLVQKGDSGKPYIIDGKIAGIIIGRKGNKAVVSTISSQEIMALE